MSERQPRVSRDGCQEKSVPAGRKTKANETVTEVAIRRVTVSRDSILFLLFVGRMGGDVRGREGEGERMRHYSYVTFILSFMDFSLK